MTEDQIKHMVDRFLGWRLPQAEAMVRYMVEGLPEPEIFALLDAALNGIQPLTGHGDGDVWRPANRAWGALVSAKNFIAASALAPGQETENRTPGRLEQPDVSSGQPVSSSRAPALENARTPSREELARAIDPISWRQFDRYGERVYSCELSLQAADRVLALLAGG